MTKKSNKKFKCKQCGECCHMVIPITILDIHRIAKYQNKKDKDIFQKVVGGVSGICQLFTIAKKTNSDECIFLDKNDLCKIHEAKPNIGNFYQCSESSVRGEMDWTEHYRSLAQRAKLWEQSVAAKITEKYIEKNTKDWNREDYFKALNSIKENTKTKESQKLKLGRTQEGVVSMLYDCSECKKRGQCAQSTPITLDDIKRISEFLDISQEEFFNNYISSEKCVATGGLKLERKEHCILFDHIEQQCSVEEVKPLHCRFTTCPVRTGDSEVREALYLGSGTIQGQFRHQVSLQITREYVARHGVNYISRITEHFQNQLDRILEDPENMQEFMNNIKKYRYIDDTLQE